ncbi:Gldg family protein [Thalassospira mesophila]|uniref:ABC transporter permease n=1 Tax=Thalassospira mesophila TaxID=1293891 RepID=A0A1Y2L4G1_9PROT|nr:Gldg family protein [Thalassospira mesophila]OSQ39433.1 ABC transporter permease [Thalassospira mesophila]
MADILRISRKEFRGFFATPAAYLFIGAFLAVNLFVFFWVETFFARNIADVQPLFKWMPVLLIFLVSALTMRAWSEERRSGTLETLLTAPVRPISLVLGKFLAALLLVVLALVLTLPLPITVSILGPLDWGPVIGGYVATLFLAAAYIAIGLYMSGRTDNPIVALILTALVCSVFYLIGSDTLTSLFGDKIGGLLAALGTGTRFQSITRGVLDLRDLYYYLSIVGVFLTLNLFSLEKLRWHGNPTSNKHRVWGAVATLFVLNFVAANFWLAPITAARADMTHQHIYSLSSSTKQELQHLQEPLVIRAYFSPRTHPLLAPLVPRVKDLLSEYQVASKGHVRVEFIDPTADPDKEQEAASKYGIRPVPFQTNSRYQSSVVNSYFDIVVAYGDQFETLTYGDLIEVKTRGEGDINVGLKNPEYEISRTIRKLVNQYQAGGNPFENMTQPVTFEGFVSPSDKLPDQLQKFRQTLDGVLKDYKDQAGDKFNIAFADPDANDGALATRLQDDYGFSPQVASLMNPQPFWFYMMLKSGKDEVQVPLPETTDKAALKRSIDSALHRMAPGFLKTIALVKPASPPPSPYMQQAPGPRYTELDKTLSENARVVETDLKDGHVPEAADLLMVMDPVNLDDKQRFAIDQFLMRGGSVVMATSPYDISITNTLSAKKVDSGLKDWLAGYGVSIDDKMVLDPQNASLPVPVERKIGGMTVQQISMMPYPHFPDLRGDQLNGDNPVTAGLGQLTLNWASPVTVDGAKNKDRTVTALLHSSKQSWLSDSTDILPDYKAHPDAGFAVSGDRGPHDLAVAIEGQFKSFYAGKESPLLADDAKNADKKDAKKGDAATAKKDDDKNVQIGGVIDRSPSSARLVLVGSNSFADDMSLSLASRGMGTRYTAPLEFMQNVIDWSLEDQSLLALRGRTQFARTLVPTSEGSEQIWEYLNYGIALIGLLAVWGWRRRVAATERKHYQRILEEV